MVPLAEVLEKGCKLHDAQCRYRYRYRGIPLLLVLDAQWHDPGEFGIMLGHSGIHMFWVSLACGLVVTNNGNLDLGSGSARRFTKARIMMRYRVGLCFPPFFLSLFSNRLYPGFHP